MKNNVNRYLEGVVTCVEDIFSVAPKKRVDLITQRSEDRIVATQYHSLFIINDFESYLNPMKQGSSS